MKYSVLFSLLLLALAVPTSASADSPSLPRDYTVVTEGGEYIMVVLSSNATGAYNQRRYTLEDPDIRKKYSHAGLYTNDGSMSPLWTIDWYAQVSISSDGRHLIKWGPWAWYDNYQELALAFYEDGKEIASYRVDQLVKQPEDLPHSVSHYTWLSMESFDDKSGQLAVETKNGEKYLFDVRTGKLIEGVLIQSTRIPGQSGMPSESAYRDGYDTPTLNVGQPAGILDALLLSAVGLAIMFLSVEFFHRRRQMGTS